MRFDGLGFPAPFALPGVTAGRPAGRLVEERDFGPNPGDLRMFRHIPARLPPGAPLVVVLHGCGQTAAAYDEGAGWSRLADRHGFALLAPDQKAANNPNGCFNWFAPDDHARGRGEAASIAQMIETLVKARKLDPRRIFITGLSAGGAMSSAMLAAYPELFAGGAIIAGLPFGAAANVYEALNAMRHVSDRPAAQWGDAVRGASGHAGPWPSVSIWQGDADAVVHAANAEAIAAQWANVHGLIEAPVLEEHNGHQRLVWRDANGRPVMESYLIAGLGHGVPITGEHGKAGPFMLEAGISSTARIAEFWGLTRRPVAKKILAAILPEPAVAPEPEAAAMPRAANDSAPEETNVDAPPRLTAYSGGGLRKVIDRALTLAGLIKP
jgi:poly(hydroxyalkanoate) depolymerase family esterase